MARTERTRWVVTESDRMVLDSSARDRKGRCWCCSGWKRPARRKARHDARRAVLRRPEDA